MSGWMDEWMGRCMISMEWFMDGILDGLIIIDWCMGEWMDGSIDGCMNGWMDGLQDISLMNVLSLIMKL